MKASKIRKRIEKYIRKQVRKGRFIKTKDGYSLPIESPANRS